MKTTQKSRTCRLTNDKTALVLHQREANGSTTVDAYFLQPVEGGLVLTKHDTTTYRVQLAGPASTCSCKGFTRWHHCKHTESLLALQQRGSL